MGHPGDVQQPFRHALLVGDQRPAMTKMPWTPTNYSLCMVLATAVEIEAEGQRCAMKSIEEDLVYSA